MVDVLNRARQDLAAGVHWKARQRLEGYIGSVGYQRDVLEMLGQVCWEMGDVPAAGRFWFFTPLNGPEKQMAVETWVRQHGGGPAQLLSAMPRRLRHTRRLRLPAEVIGRLETLEQVVPPRRPRLDTRAHAGPRRVSLLQSLDAMTLGVGMGVAIFFLYCFSVGLAKVLGL